MSDSELIRKNSLVNENIVTSGHLIRIQDISYKLGDKQTYFTGSKNFEFSFSKELDMDLERKFHPEKNELFCENTLEEKESSLSIFEDFKKFTNELNNSNPTSIFNPFSFIPFLKTEKPKRTTQFPISIPTNVSLNSLNSLYENSISDSSKSFPSRNSSTFFTSTTVKFLSDEESLDSASEKEPNPNNYNNSIKLKDNQSMTPTGASTRSSSDLVYNSSPDSFREKTQKDRKNSSNKLFRDITNNSEKNKLNPEEFKVNFDKKIFGKCFNENFSHKKREREKTKDTSSISLPKLKREDAVFFHIEKNIHKRTRKNKFQKVMDLLKDSVLSASNAKDSILENLKENISKYSRKEFDNDMQNIENHDGHCLMMKFFPNMYSQENFYKSVKIMEKRRNENYDKIFIQEKWLNTFCDPSVHKKEGKNYFLFNDSDSANSQNFPKKIWAPSFSFKEENFKDFIHKVERIWPHQKLFYSEEYLLEYLMSLNYNLELVFENILRMSVHFNEFLENKKEVTKIKIETSPELSNLIKVENISSRHYYLRKR